MAENKAACQLVGNQAQGPIISRLPASPLEAATTSTGRGNHTRASKRKLCTAAREKLPVRGQEHPEDLSLEKGLIQPEDKALSHISLCGLLPEEAGIALLELSKGQERATE